MAQIFSLIKGYWSLWEDLLVPRHDEAKEADKPGGPSGARGPVRTGRNEEPRPGPWGLRHMGRG